MINDVKNNTFSTIEHQIDKLELKEGRLRSFTEKAFTKEESLEKNKNQRLKNSNDSFDYFDKTYFTKDMYLDGYYEPCELHNYLVDVSTKNGVFITLAPREHGKTVIAKKILIWKILTGKVNIAGVYCETLTKASNILDDIYNLIFMNTRLMSDYKVEFLQANSDQIQLTTIQNKGIKTIGSFSQGRSLRGYTKDFGRISHLLIDDLETSESSMTSDSVELRIKKLSEAYQSMSSSFRHITVLGNDFDERSALHRIRKEAEEGTINEQWNVKVFKAWSDGKPLWYSKYKDINSETELKNKIGAISESDWQGNFQQNPIPPDGEIFKREHFQICNSIPTDARGVLYCDPNLSKKGKGDTTAIVSYLYSPSEDKYFVDDVRCISISDSNDLLRALFEMKKTHHNAIGMDGNVSQESNWSNNIKNYCAINKVSYPRIQFCRYNVDNIAKNMGLRWSDKDVYFLNTAIETKEGQRFMQQLFAFAGKKQSRINDDAPDSVICADELISERYLGRRVRSVMQSLTKSFGFKNNYGLD